MHYPPFRQPPTFTSHILLKWDVNAALVHLLWAIFCSFSTLPSCLWLLTGAILSVFATSCFPQPRCSLTHLQSVAPRCRSPQCHLPTPSAGPPEPRLPPPKPTPFLSGFQSLQTRGHSLKRKAQKNLKLLFLLPASFFSPSSTQTFSSSCSNCSEGTRKFRYDFWLLF